MSKARKKNYKQGTAKRLVQESCILSCTRFLSSRFVRFFESGFASPLINSTETVDDFARERVTGPLYKRVGMKKNFSMPARNAIASFINNSAVSKLFSAFRVAFLNATFRSLGIFLLTFGIYAAAVFLLKSYVSLNLGTSASVTDMCVAAIAVIAGLFLTLFGDKGLLAVVGKSRIVGRLLLGNLGVNDSSVTRYISSRPKTYAGFGFLLGSLFGIITLFYSPANVLLFLLSVTVAAVILHIPEFGLLLAVLIFSFVPASLTAFAVCITVLSYLLKCIRLKRNFRFGTADAVMLLMFAVMYFTSFVFGGVTSGEYYILIFTAVYFLAKNLLCSKTLVVQAFSALCTGVTLGLVLYTVGDFASLISHNHLRNAALVLTENVLRPDVLAMLTVCTLPIAMSSYSSTFGNATRNRFVLFALIGAFVIDSKLFYILLAVSLLVYITFSHKAPFGALLCAAIIIPPILVFSTDYTLSTAVSVGRAGYDGSLALETGGVFSNFWSGMYEISNGATVCLFILALLLILQRAFRASALNDAKSNLPFGGAIAAAAVTVLVCSLLFNPFSDLRSLVAVWFVLGLVGAVYGVCLKETNEYTEV
jgi:hypothetical protein